MGEWKRSGEGPYFEYSSPFMRHALELCGLYADVDRPVIFLGPVGAGKTTLAYYTHGRAEHDGPFVTVSAGELSETLFADRLLGHVEGAFTGALGKRPGAFAEASGGTLLFDDLALTPKVVQAAILRVLDTRRFRPLGAKADRVADCRMFFASTVALPELMDRGDLLPDLRSRLGEFVIKVPALRRRNEDILPTAEKVAAAFQDEHGAHGRVEFTPDAREALERYRWPMNLRELKSVVERAVTHAGLSDSNVLVRLAHLPDRFHDLDDVADPEGPDLSRGLVNSVLDQVDGNKSEAARVLGVHRNTVARYVNGSG